MRSALLAAGEAKDSRENLAKCTEERIKTASIATEALARAEEAESRLPDWAVIVIIVGSIVVTAVGAGAVAYEVGEHSK